MKRYKYYDEDYEILKYAYDILLKEMGGQLFRFC